MARSLTPLTEIMTKFFLFHILPVLAAILLCFNSIFIGSIYLVIAFLLVIPYLLRNYKVITTNKAFSGFFLCVLVGSFANLLTTQNGIGGTVNFLAAVGLTIYALNNPRTIGYVALALCAFTLYFVYYNLFYLGTDINLIYEKAGLSKNYPGYIMVMCCCVWGYTKYIRSGHLPLVLPILCTIIAFFLDGRSSLGVLALMSVFCVFFQFRNYKLISIAIGLALIYYFWDDLAYYYSFTNLSESGTATSRYRIWAAYFEHLDPISFTFGLDTLSVPLLREYGGNPHNAFLNYHYRMGILGTGALIYVIVKSVRILCKERAFMLLFFTGALLVRIFFDACIGGPQDFLVFFIFWHPILCRTDIKNLDSHIKEQDMKTRKKWYNRVIRLIEKYI